MLHHFALLLGAFSSIVRSTPLNGHAQRQPSCLDELPVGVTPEYSSPAQVSLVPRLLNESKVLDDPFTNGSCSNVQSTKGSKAWSDAIANVSLDKFVDMWTNDKLTCIPCWGQSKSDCQHTDLSGCQDGIQTQAKSRNGSTARWDTGIGIYSNLTDVLLCGGGDSCGHPNCEELRNSSQAYVLIKSLYTLSSWLNVVSTALTNAQLSAEGDTTKFSTVFAPLPKYDSSQLWVSIAASAFSGIIGSIGGIGGLAIGGAAAVAGGVQAALVNNLYSFSEDKTPADVGAALSGVGDRLVQGTDDFANTLMGTGTWVFKNGTTQTLADILKDGKILDMDIQSTDNHSLVNIYKRVIFQQLGYYTWTNLNKDNWQPQVFITFAPGKCSDINYSDNTKSPIVFTRQDDTRKLSDFDSHIDWNGSCYWLLGVSDQHTGSFCDDVRSLPGGTNKELKDNDFGGLSLEDFIIPSVRGFQDHGNDNGYPIASANGALVLDPQASGALNITVCDYLKYNQGGLAGIDCSQIHQRSDDGVHCKTEPANAVANAAAAWSTGLCKVHLEQTNKMPQKYNQQWDELNPYMDQYQLESETFDADGRSIGNTAMQWVGGIMDLWNSVLPYVILVHVADDSQKAMEFWYGDQYWNSDDPTPGHRCNTSKYDSGAEKEMRHIDCFFDCPKPAPTASPSATISHPLPTNAKFEDPEVTSSISNSFSTEPRPTGVYQGENYHAGPCWIQVNQYKMTDPNKFWVEAFLKQTNDARDSFTWIEQGMNGKEPVNANDDFVVAGLAAGNSIHLKFDSYTTNGGNGHVHFSYAGNEWMETDTSHEHDCKYENYDGHTNVRPIWCFFTCVGST